MSKKTMNMITRHNYEEYFILYMDNELGSEERRMVEAFIEKNPDLKDELDILLQYKLEPDTSITFSNKEGLMRPPVDEPSINISNYEEWLVLYTDNELTVSQQKEVEDFVAADVVAKKELDLLLKAKLQPETIIFADKASLYRTEEKVRPLMPRWMKYAAAVLLFIVGITVVILTNNKKNSSTGADGTLADGQSKETKTVLPQANGTNTNENPVAVKKEDNKEVVTPVTTSNEQQTATANNQRNNTMLPKNNQPVPQKIVPFESPAPEKNEVVKAPENNNKPTNNLPQPLNNPYNNTPKDAVVKNVPPVNNNIPNNPLTKDVVTTANPQPSDPVEASFAVDNGNGKKSKLRGFFRKVTRTFEKRTNIDPTDGEDRLLVAGLSIKMK